MSAEPASGGSSATAAGTFGEWLAGLSDDTLLTLLSARPDVTVPPPADFDVLGRRLAAAASVSRALERVDRFGLELLEMLVLFGGAAGAAELADRTGLDVDVVEQGFDRLRRLGLLWGEDAASLPRGVADEVGPHPLGFGRSAAHLLRTEFLPEERAVLAATLGVTGDAPDRAAASDHAADPHRAAVSDAGRAQVSELVALFDDPTRVDALVAGIGAPERAVLERLADGAPVGSTAAPVSVVGLDEATTAVGRLLAQGLLMPAGGDLVELPREVALALQRRAGEMGAAGAGGTTWSELVAGRLHPQPPALEGPVVGVGAVDASAATTAAELLRRCDALLGRWEAAPPVLTRSGGLPVRELRAAAKDLDLPVDTVAVVAELLRAADLVAPTPGSEVSIVPTEDVDDWRTLDNAARWARVAAAWLALEALPGLATSVQPQRGPLVEDVDPAKPLPVFSWDLRRPGAAAARREILGVLAAAPVGTAATGDSIRARLAWQGPRRNAVWWSVLVAWTLAEADLLGVTGRGALASAGRALLDGPDGPDSMKEAAKAAAAVMHRHLPPPLDHVLVQADLTAVAPGPLEPVLAREIGLVADVESAGTATVFRFSESSLRRALDAGRSAADVQALIARAARGTVPQALTYLVDDVARRHGRLRAGLASSYVRCDDPALLAEVVAARRTGSVDLRQIAPTVAVSSAPLDRVLEVLRGAGYSPAGEGANGVVRIEKAVAERVPVPVRRATASATSGVPPEHLRTTVTRLRRAASAADAARSGAVRTEVGGAITSPGAILTRLGEVVDAGGVVRMAYVNLEGRSTERVVHPLLLSGGYLTAYDEHSGERRTFAVSRISSLVVLADSG